MEDVKMYLLIVCALSWLVLLGSLITAWTGLPQPRTATDIVVIVVIAAATAVFARLGLVSIIALLLRTLPDGRVRSVLASFVIRAMPRLVASSALTVISAGIAVQAGHASTQQDRAGPAPHPVGGETVAEARSEERRVGEEYGSRLSTCTTTQVNAALIEDIYVNSMSVP